MQEPLMITEEENIIATKLKLDEKGQQALEEKLNSFQVFEQEALGDYLSKANKRKSIDDNILLTLSGFSKETARAAEENPLLNPYTSTWGTFIRFHGKGIIINPGEGFLEAFHEAGFFATDIDACIVTTDLPQATEDILALYHLNFRLNQINPEHKIIHYYLNQATYRELGAELKPNFKQEKNTVHCLELFVDSPDVETVDLFDGITLEYFAASKELSNSLGVVLDLNNQHRMGYLTDVSWTPFFGQHFGKIDVLVLGFGKTEPNDFGKLHPSDGNLGYFGTFNLMEEVAPRLLLCQEFDATQGDIRFEVARKLRQENQKSETTILPADTGLTLSFDDYTLAGVSLEDVQLQKEPKPFGRLKLVAKETLL